MAGVHPPIDERHIIIVKRYFLQNVKDTAKNFVKLLEGGKNIIGPDIPNSHPLIASYLFKKFYTDDNLPIPDDVIQYQRDCEQGIFYDDFMKAMNLPKEFRSEFKKDFFQMVFFDKVYHTTNRLLDLFIEKYPSVWNVIKEEKGGYALSKDDKKFAQ